MYGEGLIDIESWSLYSLEQRMMAGAMGVGFMPTKSLMGTSLGDENGDSFKITTDPFDAKAKIGVVKALVPDLSLIHGCVADPEGNVILSPPYFTSIWGARASKEGVIATVEKIVPSEVIRKQSALVKLPGHLVKCVCPVPFGSHPQGLAAESIGVTEGYAEDYDFIRTFVDASQTAADLEAWLKEWVVQCDTQDEYLRRLGAKRILLLKGKSSPDAWKYEALGSKSDRRSVPQANKTEIMVIAAAKEIKRVTMERGHNTILAGIGSPGLAAWLAYYMLKEASEDVVTLMTGLGQVGYSPRPGDPFLMSLGNVMGSTSLTDTVEVYGTLVGGAHNRCLSVLGTAQIDQYGNLNTVKIGDVPFIGVGGAGDAVNARETLVVARQSPKRFMKQIPYIGCAGKKIKTLVTDLGVFEKLGDDGIFSLTKVVTDASSRRMEERLQEIKERCGWEIKPAESLEEISPPTLDEINLLRALDPEGLFLGK